MGLVAASLNTRFFKISLFISSFPVVKPLRIQHDGSELLTSCVDWIEKLEICGHSDAPIQQWPD